MQKKWGYTSAIATFASALISLGSVFVDAAIVSILLGALTLTLSAITVTFIKLTPQVSQIRNASTSEAAKSEIVKPSKKHTESISHAIDSHPNTDIDVKANTESATNAKVEDLEEPHRDEESGLLSGTFFPVYLEQRITAARRTLRPVSLVIFELDGLDKNDSNSPSDRNFYISAVGDVVKRTLRESDCAFRIDENIFAAAMDDTTESGAVWAAERVRGVLHTGALAGRVTVSAGVACYPSHALESEDLINCANKALEAAKARGVDQVEIATETAVEQ